MGALRDDAAWLDATGQADLVRRGEIREAELLETAIGRVEDLNPILNAVIHPLFDKARRRRRVTCRQARFRASRWSSRT